MLRNVILAAIVVAIVGRAAASGEPAAAVAIVGRGGGSFAESLAIKEVRRYFYVRTGRLLPVVETLGAAPTGGLFLVGVKGQPVVQAAANDGEVQKAVAGLAAEQYVLKSLRVGDRPVVLIAGGDPIGTLYGAYRLAEKLGVRFYLHGDEMPDRLAAATLPEVDEIGRPLFDRRGIQPFHDFPEGPDWWSTDAYQAVIGQLPKLRMNFFGLHTYPEGGVGPEPLTWIGRPEDLNADGTVKASYPSRHFVTSNVTGAWGYHPLKTADYAFGAAALFDRDDFGADYMRDTFPWNKLPPEAQNALFHRMGAVLKEAFTFARQIGVKTCLGTETPLIIPTPVKERLKAAGKDPADPAVVKEVYRAMFERIAKTHPLDYYWFWTPEGWTWSPVAQAQIDATLADFAAAIAAAKEAKAPFALATCGWVLGPQQNRALFDQTLPKDMPMSCINRMVGHAPVEPGFSAVKGRPTWAIPWMEDDPAMISPQLWVGRMRKDAVDAKTYGCSGLLGIHWRTRILGPNVSALAAAAWDQSGWKPAASDPTPTGPQPPEGPIGGQFAAFPNNKIADTEEPTVYQTVRYNVEAYHLDVPNGKYTVTVKLCEPHYREAGKRVFGVKVQGRTLIEKIDLLEKVGQNRAIDFALRDVEVTNGRLVIDFVPVVEFPLAAAIVVEGPNGKRKINCGGPAWQDYAADWPAVAEGPRKDRFLPTDDFYADWARVQFGPEVAKPAAAIFTTIDGFLPRPSDWVNGPGGIKPDGRPWTEVAKQYAFVDELAALRPQVEGRGQQERFDYWLNTFRYMRANARVNCTWARFNQAMERIKAEKDAAAQQRLAREVALPIRKELVAQVADVYKYLLSAVTTYGEIGNVTNWQQHLLPGLLEEPGKQLSKYLGEPLPADALPGKEYQGPPRLFVPVLRTSIAPGEPLLVRAIALDPTRATAEATLCWRPLGSTCFTRQPLTHVARGVYCGSLSPDRLADDFEYYVEVKSPTVTLRYPPTAPELNQTVVVVK